MAFYEEWKARQETEAIARQALIEQARREYVGRRVWVRSECGQVYGEVECITEQGKVYVVYDYDGRGHPRYMITDVALFGKSVWLAADWIAPFTPTP